MEDKYILFEQVTDMDKNKKNLAHHIAMCNLYNKQYDKRAILCYNALSLCDQLDVDRQASIIYGLKKASVKIYNQSLFFECLKFIIPWLFILIIAIFILVNISCIPKPHDSVSKTASKIISPYSYSSTMDDDILKVINTANNIVHDYDGDNVVNCVDRAIAFKVVWDQYFGDCTNYKCEIVRNYNKGIMNHLFIRVKCGMNQWIYVEPAYDPKSNLSYEMWDVWGSMYDPLYNLYGETNLWLARGKIW